MNLCYICYEYKIKQKDCYKRLMPNRFLISQPCHRSTGWPRSTDATSVRLRLILFCAAAAHRREEREALGKITVPEKRVAIIFGLVVLGWVLRRPLSAELSIQGLSDTAIALGGALLL